jgi:hypothetical protein
MSGNNSKPDILDILRGAEEQNRADMNAGAPARDPELEKTKVHGDEEAPKKRTKVTKRINAETAELIDKYSDHKESPKLTDTQRLRAKLAEQNENKELLGYLSEEKQQGKSERVEKLYQMISDARTRTITDEEKKPPAGISTSRFSDTAEVKTEEYTQEQMFHFGDTLHFDETVEDSEVASYDSDYAQLSEKVAGRELDFENDDQSEGQVKFDTDTDDPYR